MIVKEINGDIIEEFEKGTIDMIVHGANCFHTMGAGLAKQIKEKYPKAYGIDKKTLNGNICKLGKRSVYTLPNGKFIINAYTQYQPGATFEYSALVKFLKTLNIDFDGTGYIIGFPEIGCGIGGGNWKRVKELIEEYTPNLKIVIVHYDNKTKTMGNSNVNQLSFFKRLKRKTIFPIFKSNRV